MSDAKTGLLTAPVRRQVLRVDVKKATPASRAVYTLPETAAALGKSVLTVKRWVTEELIPEPIFEDTVYGYRQFLSSEVRVIAEELRKHEQKYAYLTNGHSDVIERIHARIEVVRDAKSEVVRDAKS